MIEQQIRILHGQNLLQIQEQKQKLRGKSIHQTEWNIEDYCKIFQIPENKINEINQWFLGILNIQNDSEIKILSPGVGAGRNELQLIIKLAKEYPNSKVICDLVDYSYKSCQYLKTILEKLNFVKDYSQGIVFKKDNIEIKIVIQDFEIWLKENKDKNYDIILSFFLINFLSNWRESILGSIGLLNADGVLIISQDLGDLCFLDNSFHEIPSRETDNDRYNFFKLWREYYEIRREYGLDWNNLISPSNMCFVERCFSDIHLLSDQNTSISKDFYWHLGDCDPEETGSFKALSYWIDLIEGNETSDEVFNCLNIPEKIDTNELSANIREDIANKLREKYNNIFVNDLTLGEKLFYLKRPLKKDCANFKEICRYVFKRNNFSITNTTAYKFSNRCDNVTESSKIPLKFSLQNRALDIYHCLVHDKDKAMVSMFSKEVIFQGNKIEYSWRQDDTPFVYPSTYSNEDVEYYLISYSIYFQLKKEGEYLHKLTGLVHNDFPYRTGIIFSLKENVSESVEPVFYQNSSKIKAFIITISKNKFKCCQDAVRQFIQNENLSTPLQDLFDKQNVFKKKFSSTDLLIEIEKTLKVDVTKIKNVLAKYFITANKQLAQLIINYLKAEANNISEEVIKQVHGVFDNIYLIALSHPVDCNTIVYTTTNIDYSSEGTANSQEQSYYGLIVADCLPDETYIENYYDQLLSNTFSYSGMDGIHEQKAKDEMMKLNARKAAISQVLARNLSHNHGSHVLSRMIHSDQINAMHSEHEGIRQILSKKIIDKNMSAVNCDITGHEVNEANVKELTKDTITFDIDKVNAIAKKMQYLSLHTLNKKLSINEKIAYFNSYEKSRMDFLADIATATPTMESSKLFYGELIAGFDKNRILLDRISGIDNFKYRISLHDCRHCDKSLCFLDDCRKEISLENDFAVTIPNDIIGQHAFYNIIENLIRNTAKHSAKQPDGSVTFHIEVREPDKEQCKRCPALNSYYEIHIYDSIDMPTEEVTLEQDDIKFFMGNDLKEIQGVDGKVVRLENDASINTDKLIKMVYRQNIYINQNLLDKENKLRQGALGMIEMEASAAYLRKIPVENIDNEEYTLDLDDLGGAKYCIKSKDCKTANILKAFIKKTKNAKRHLAYRFFMLKPKEILIVLDNEAIEKLKNENKIDLAQLSSALINYGIWLNCKGNNTALDGIEPFVEGKIYEHEILLNMTQNEIEPNIGVLPDRIVKADLINDLAEIVKDKNVKEFKEKVWEEFGSMFKINIENYKSIYQFEFYSNNQLSAVFDHHGTQWKEWLIQFPESQQFIEITTGLNIMTTILGRAANKSRTLSGWVSNPSYDKVIYYKLCDSVNQQIIIIDERIQEAAENLKYKPENGNDIPFKEIYLTTGIIVPDKKSDIDLSKQTYGNDARANIISFLNKVKQEELKKRNGNIPANRIKFIVVHLGVLEKILSVEGKRKADSKEEQLEIENLITDFLQVFNNAKIKPVLVSGRGLPANAPRKFSFVNFSALAQHSIDSRNKFMLNELLYAARNINNNNNNN